MILFGGTDDERAAAAARGNALLPTLPAGAARTLLAAAITLEDEGPAAAADQLTPRVSDDELRFWAAELGGSPASGRERLRRPDVQPPTRPRSAAPSVAPLPTPSYPLDRMPVRALLVVMSLLALVAACGDPAPSKYPTQPTVVEDSSLGPDDQLEITVYLGGGATKVEDISKVYPVSTDGALSFPMIGTVEATGRSPQSVEDEIRDRLADGYIVNPNVTVQVKEYRSKKISIFGEVRKPGTLTWRPSMTINEAVSEAAGFTNMARPNAAVVTRRAAGGKTDKFTVPIEKIANNSAPQFYMRPGDSIYIPKRLF